MRVTECEEGGLEGRGLGKFGSRKLSRKYIHAPSYGVSSVVFFVDFPDLLEYEGKGLMG